MADVDQGGEQTSSSPALAIGWRKMRGTGSLSKRWEIQEVMPNAAAPGGLIWRTVAWAESAADADRIIVGPKLVAALDDLRSFGFHKDWCCYFIDPDEREHDVAVEDCCCGFDTASKQASAAIAEARGQVGGAS